MTILALSTMWAHYPRVSAMLQTWASEVDG